MFRTLVMVGVTAVLAGTGCASDAPATQDAAEPPSSASAGAKISGTGYAYNVPERWGPSTHETPGFDLDSLAVQLQDRDGFADNINVIITPAGDVTPQQAEEAAENELAAVGATDISVQERVTVAGSEYAHLSAVASLNGNDYRVEQFYLTDDGQMHVVTFSFSTSVTSGDRDTITDTVLTSWTWTD